MDDKIKERIRLVLKEYNTNPTKLSKGDQALQRKFSRQLNDAEVTYSLIAYILDAFPDVSAEWLIRGQGDMQAKSETFPIDEELNKDFDLNQSVSRTEFILLANQVLELTKLAKLQGRELKSVNERMVIVEDRLRQTKSA